MTRLIDADEIVYEETLRCAGRTGNCISYYHDYHVLAGDIDKMPTVDAIPVSFIESEIKRMELEIDIAMSEGDDERAERWIIRQTAVETVMAKWRAEGEEE